MGQNSFAPRYVKTFSESYQQRLDPAGLNWIDDERPAHIDQQVKAWVESEKAWILDVQPVMRTSERGPFVRQVDLCYTVLYEPDRPATKPAEIEEEEDGLPELPLKEGARSPTLEAVRANGPKRFKVAVMAGVFGVVEGDKLHPEDTQPAPPVLLAPRWDWSYGAELFGNVNKEEEKVHG